MGALGLGGAPTAPLAGGAADPDRWDEALAGFADATLEQSARYAGARWPGHDEHGPVIIRDGRIRAMARVVTCPLPGLGGGLAYVKFGPVWRPCDAAADPEDYRAVVRGLIEHYCERRGMMLTISPRPSPDVQRSEQSMLEELGFRIRRPMDDRYRYLVDLSLDETSQRASLGQSWRRNLNSAMDAGLSIAEESGPEGIAAFQALHAEMVARKNASHGDPVELLPDLCGHLPAGLAPRVVLARHGGRPVAGAVIGVNADCVHYLFGATADRALELRAGYALHWWIVGRLRGTGPRFYDLGGIVGNEGLRRFKQGLVGKRGHVLAMAGEFDCWHGARAHMLGDAVHLLRRGRALVAAHTSRRRSA